MRTLLASAAVGAVVLAAATPAAARSSIVGGAPDTTNLSAVMILVEGTSTEGWATCSGSVVAPHAVLTAAHCMDPATSGFASPTYKVFIGPDVYDPARKASDYFAVASVHENPAFAKAQIAGNDVGLVVTKDALPLAPLAFRRTPVTGALVGQTLRLVGYGLTDPTDGGSDGVRSSGTGVVESVNAQQIVIAAGTMSGCEGDSGGPALLEGAGGPGSAVVTGIISYGLARADCHGQSFLERVDTHVAFIDSVLAVSDPGFVPPGATPDAGAADPGKDGGADVTDAGAAATNDATATTSGCSSAPARRPGGALAMGSLALAIAFALRAGRRRR